MGEQLVFTLPIRAAMGRDDFFVSPGNAVAVAGIDTWAEWPFGKMVLVGEAGAGKTHLAHVWADMAGAEVVEARDLTDHHGQVLAGAGGVAVEDVDQIAGREEAETALFHLHNALAQADAPLLLTARDAPERWGLHLPDLDSRMRQAGVLRLGSPDDALLSAVMMKLAHDRNMPLKPRILSYALARIERSFAAAQAFIAALDAMALAAKRAPTRKMAKAILAEDKQ
ncbi:chromosomal replication initiator DnaA [Rhodophyticola sp. CCM32]|uniref:DnaA ATPase domain-containing protein n=1 Tax=Rhodophyticola sp. CCM32 TaxID=2916397 RepID=UPI00107F2105|nr:DnaA/Hda family protein [Rhodophyticola sp. CCM32]QBY01116.1 chromosomal replication initiator DnaA [Rhodophyticola sp. CCM32]